MLRALSLCGILHVPTYLNLFMIPEYVCLSIYFNLRAVKAAAATAAAAAENNITAA